MPEPHVILGLRLLPLSLGRYRLLKRFDCPFVADDERSLDLEILTSELFFALAVCGFPCREFEEHVADGTLKDELAEWSALLTDQIASEKHFSIIEKAEHFKRYISEGSRIPWEILEKQTQCESSPTHWSLAIETTLMSKMGWTEEMIEERPLTKALSYFFKFMESEGAVKLVDPEVWAARQVEAQANGNALAEMMKSWA